MSTIDWVRESEYLRGLLSQEKKKNAILESDIRLLKELWFNQLQKQREEEKRDLARVIRLLPDSCVEGGI